MVENKKSNWYHIIMINVMLYSSSTFEENNEKSLLANQYFS